MKISLYRILFLCVMASPSLCCAQWAVTDTANGTILNNILTQVQKAALDATLVKTNNRLDTIYNYNLVNSSRAAGNYPAVVTTPNVTTLLTLSANGGTYGDAAVTKHFLPSIQVNDVCTNGVTGSLQGASASMQDMRDSCIAKRKVMAQSFEESSAFYTKMTEYKTRISELALRGDAAVNQGELATLQYQMTALHALQQNELASHSTIVELHKSKIAILTQRISEAEKIRNSGAASRNAVLSPLVGLLGLAAIR